MKNKILAVFFLLSFSSCGIFVYTNAPLASNNVIEETKEVDTTTKFIGKYDITVFDVPDVGVIELVMNVSNDGDLYIFGMYSYPRPSLLQEDIRNPTTNNSNIFNLFFFIFLFNFTLNTYNSSRKGKYNNRKWRGAKLS